MHVEPLLQASLQSDHAGPNGCPSHSSSSTTRRGCCTLGVKLLVTLRTGFSHWWATTSDHDYLSSWASRRDQQKVVVPLVASMGMVADLISDNIDPVADVSALILAIFFSFCPKHRLLPDMVIAAFYCVGMVCATGSEWYELNNILNNSITSLLAGIMGFHSTVVVSICMSYTLLAAANSPSRHPNEFTGVLVHCTVMTIVCVMLEYRVACGVAEMMRVIQEATDGYFHCDPASLRVVMVSDGLQKKLGEWATQAMQQQSLLAVVDQRDHAAVLGNLGHRSTETLLVTLRRQSEDGQRSTADCRFSFFNMSWSRQQQVCVQIQGEWRLDFDEEAGARPPAPVAALATENGNVEGMKLHNVEAVPPPTTCGTTTVGRFLCKENIDRLPRVHAAGQLTLHRAPSEPGSTMSERAVENMHADEVESVVGLQQLASLGQDEHWMHSSSDLVLMPDQKLGEGSFGIVVAGRLHGTPIAVKLAKGVGTSWDHRGWPELANELRVLRRLRHPHIVGFFGACVDPQSGVFALLMELLSGMPLQSYVESSTSFKDRHPVVLQLCHALRYLHALTPVVVHGDLKPSNIVVESCSTGPRAKLLDFGLSRLLTRRVRAFGGSVAWRAPEVARGSEFCGTSADVFSLGRVCHFVLSGQHPFEGFTAAKVKQLIKQPVATPLEWPTLSPKCARLWDLCLTYDPIQRPTVDEVDIEMTRFAVEADSSAGQLWEVSFETAVQELCQPLDFRAGVSAHFCLADESYPIETASPDWIALFGPIKTVMDVVPHHKADDFRKFLEIEFERRFIAGEPNLDKVVVFKRLRFTQKTDHSEYKATLVVVFPAMISSLPSNESDCVHQSFTAQLKLENLSLHRLHRQAQAPDVLPTLTEEAALERPEVAAEGDGVHLPVAERGSYPDRSVDTAHSSV